MTRREHDPSLSSLSLESLERIDNVCVAFESELANKKQPKIEDFLKSDSADEKKILLRELLQLELAAKETQGLEATRAEYETRFAEFTLVVRDAFSSSAAVAEELEADSASARDYSGQLIAGRYQVGSLLGSGAFSDVYLAEDVDQQRTVALKVLKPQAGVDLDQLLNEAKTLTGLEHPNIVAAYDFGRFDDSAFIALQYIDGQTLAAKISEDGAIDSTEAVGITTAICDALHFAHQHGLTHRDIKPHNILIDSSGHPFVADFGFALHESVQDQHFGDRSGTPYYRSPEQVRGEADWIDGRADIWAVGAVLYEMLTGRRPFKGDSIEEIDRQILGRSPKPPRQIDSNIPEWLEAVSMKCLLPSPADRYATAKELSEALQKRTHPQKSLKLSRKLTVSAAALLVLFSTIAAGSFFVAHRASRARVKAETAALETVEYVIRNLHDDLQKISGPGSTANRSRMINQSVEAVDRIASKTRYADLLRANTRYRLAELLVEKRGAKNLKTAGTRLDEALEILRQRDEKSDATTDRTPYLQLFGNVHDALGQIDYLKEDFSAALADFELAHKFRKEWLQIVLQGAPTNASPFAYAAKDAAPEIHDITELDRVEQAIADSQYNFGRIYRKDPQKSVEAQDCFAEAAAARERYFLAHPTYLQAKRDYAGSLRDLAKAQVSLGDYGPAIINYKEAIDLTQKVIDEGKANPGKINLYPPRSNLAVYLSDLGEALMRNGQLDEAAAPLNNSQNRLTSLHKEYETVPTTAKYLRGRLGECWYLLGIRQIAAKPHEATDCFRNSKKTWGGYDRIYPLARLHERKEAMRLTLEAKESLASVDRADYTLDLAKCFAVCAWSAKVQSETEEYVRFRDQAIQLLKNVLEKGVPVALVRDDLDLQFLCEDPTFVDRMGQHFGAAASSTGQR